MKRGLKKTGFTLVEVLIVVVILAILAAAIIPQFSDSTTDAKTSTALFNLNTLRAQIQLYKAQHNGASPTTLAKLTVKTKADQTESGGTLGPYLQYVPDNPLADAAVANVVGAPNAVPPTATTASVGWLYDATSGNIYINYTSLLAK